MDDEAKSRRSRDSRSVSRGELIAMVGLLRGQLYDYVQLLGATAGMREFYGINCEDEDQARQLWESTAFDVEPEDEPTRAEKDRAQFLEDP